MSLPSDSGSIRFCKAEIASVLFIAAAILAFIYVFPIAQYSEWFNSHEYARYPYLTELFGNALKQGIWYPRWMPELMGGYGYPTFVYYQPGYFYLVSIFYLAINHPVVANYFAVFCALMWGMWGAYRLSGMFVSSLGCRVVAVASFIAMPYLAANLYLRGDLSEFLAMLLVPWVLYWLLKVSEIWKQEQPVLKPLLWLTAATAAVVISHPFVALFLAPVMLLMFLALWLEQRFNFLFALAIGCSQLLCLVITTPYWLTLLQMKEEVRFQGAVFWHKADTLEMFLSNAAFSNPGLGHLAIAAIGLVLGLRRISVLAVGVMLLAYLFLMLEWSQPLWDRWFVLQCTQFPWRINAVIASLLLIGIACFLGLVDSWLSIKNWRWLSVLRWLIPILALLLMLLFALISEQHWKFGRQLRLNTRYDVPNRMLVYEAFRQYTNHLMTGLAGADEFMPVRATTLGLPHRIMHNVPLALPVNPKLARVAIDPESSAHRLKFNVFVLQDGSILAPVAVLINQFYLPGWKVKVTPWDFGKPPANIRQYFVPLSYWGPGDRGLIQLEFINSGVYHVEAWYDGPPGWEMRNLLIAVLGWLLLAGLWQLEKHKQASEKARAIL